MELAHSPSAFLANPLAFLQPTARLNASFLTAAKRYLDPIASAVSHEQIARQQHLRRKRKRGEAPDGDAGVLRLKKLHVEGFSADQVFQQTSKVVDAAVEEIELLLPQEDGPVAIGSDEASQADLDGQEIESASSLGEEGVDWEYDGEDVADEEGDLNGEEGHEDPASGEEDQLEDEEEHIFSDALSQYGQAATYRPDNGVDDEFFQLDTFNRQTGFLEQQDTRGEAADSDDEEIDWDADPFAATAGKAAKAVTGDESDDENGPTFGNVDLHAPEGLSDDEFQDGEMDGVDSMDNANNLMYKDFFAPPARKESKRKRRGRPNPHNFPPDAAQPNNEDMEDQVRATMSRVHRDLFEDDDSAESDGELTDLDSADPKSRQSTYQRRQAKIAEQIRKLEAANVARREWQLSGEASAGTK